MVVFKYRLNEWTKRYLPAEILGILGTVFGGLLINFITNSPLLTALGATWGENIGYYGKVIHQDLRNRKDVDGKISIISIFKTLRNIIIEFGSAEYFDSFITRPFAMYYLPIFLGNLTFGLIIGKLLADVTFYIPTIISYELREKYIKD